MPEILGIELHIWADYIAFAFALLASILCAIQIHHHIYHNHEPQTRKYIIRILLMVIVYCIESWFGLYDPHLSLYLDTIRDTYEALVIYSFYQLLICSLGGYQNVQDELGAILLNERCKTDKQSSTFPHLFPFKYCCKAWSFKEGRSGNGGFLRNTTIGVLQYCLIQPLTAIITFILHISNCHCYGEGEFNYKVGYPYITFIRSVSQTWAIYCLVLFYLALKKCPKGSYGQRDFTRIRPIPKFMCIKGVVFLTYWQSVMLAGLVYLGVIKETNEWNVDNIATGLQDILICIEMFGAAIAHIFAFKVDDFNESKYTPLIPPHKVLFDVANVTDVLGDASTHMLKRRTNASLLHSDDDENDNENDNNNSLVKNKNTINSKPTSLERDLNEDEAL
eukprot:387220_1